MSTEEIWSNFGNEVYFFLLKKVKNKNAAQDILQNTFYKIHLYAKQLTDQKKVRSWVFSITRHEMANYFHQQSKRVEWPEPKEDGEDKPVHLCCFDRFINELPPIYREVIEMVYLSGKKQSEVATALGISLANVKARIRRSKDILKMKFHACCKLDFDQNGRLVGEPDCPICQDRTFQG